VTGFGIKGHSGFLASVQKQDVDIIINNLPTIRGMASIDNTVKNYKLREGLSAETSGGLLICLSKENAKSFIKEMHDNGLESNYAGEVVKGTK
jgi:selenide, water dikinase